MLMLNSRNSMSENKYYYGTGRRKTAVARVRLYSNNKDIIVNDKPTELPKMVVEPLEAVGKSSSFGISAKVSGGGWAAQLEAIRLGIARALVEYNEDFRSSLKKSGLLSRDPREKERKKPGLKKARRAPQWSKR